MLSSAVADMEEFDNQEVYFLGDLNLNLLNKPKYILDTKHANERYLGHNLKQLIRSPIRVAKSC